jgi:ABC-type antimicrobial peptide transport system permease subunit
MDKNNNRFGGCLLPGVCRTAKRNGDRYHGALSSIRLPLVFPPDLYLACFTGAIAAGFMVTLVVAKRMSVLKPADAWRKL